MVVTLGGVGVDLVPFYLSTIQLCCTMQVKIQVKNNQKTRLQNVYYYTTYTTAYDIYAKTKRAVSCH